MEKMNNGSRTQPILSQTENNTTLWIGQLKSDPTDRYAGQTFTCPADGLLNNIQLYSSLVNEPGEITLTMHEFDTGIHSWGPGIGSSVLSLQKGDDSRWIRFEMEPVALRRDVTYGFRLYTSNASIGLGEAVHDSKKPFSFGQAWNGDANNIKGNFFRYFSLAFKVEMCA